MPLTAADVEAKQFGSSRLARRGYDEAEVDDFLDEVQAELVRREAENADLRARLQAAEGELAELRRRAGEPGGAEAALAEVAPAGELAVPPAEAAARVLALAERTAEQHVAEVRAEADRTLAEARSRAEEISRQADEREQRALGELDQARSELARRVEGLRAFEREYRSRLRAYLEDQLRELGSAPDAAPALASVGGPPGTEPPGPVPADESTPPPEHG